uniref:Ribosomal protein S15 n=1 Tax=Heterorhabditis bacteriophora TaxID=37862 RepID=A0A1I7WME5_HETBA
MLFSVLNELQNKKSLQFVRNIK